MIFKNIDMKKYGVNSKTAPHTNLLKEIDNLHRLVTY